MALNQPPAKPSPLPAADPLRSPDAGTTQTPSGHGRPGVPPAGGELPNPVTPGPG